MPTLYNCHTDGDQYRITKFDSLGNVESTYLCSETECECPAGHRPSCRHRQMLPKFLERNAVNSFWFLDWDRKGWVTNEPKTQYPIIEPAEPRIIEEASNIPDEMWELPQPEPVTIATMQIIPDDASVAEEFAKLLHPEPAPPDPKPFIRRA
jgi:hypothetical protein